MKLTRIRRLVKDGFEGSGNEFSYLKSLTDAIENDTSVITFLHNTKTEALAKIILDSGFEFQSHIDHTTDVVSPKDPVTIKYFTIVRQAYGNYTLIIQISKELIEEYSEMLHNKPHHFSEVLSIQKPYLGFEDDLIYCLAPHFVKGYVNANNSCFVPNPEFNPSLKIPIFEDNLKRILAGET